MQGKVLHLRPQPRLALALRGRDNQEQQHTSEAMSLKTKISSETAPAAIGPYSQAVRVGDLIFTSGQVALDPATGALVAGGIREQTERVFANLAAVLEAADAGFPGVIKATVYLKDIGDFAAMNEIYARHLAAEGVVAPARTTVEVARLPKDALVEIDLIAVTTAKNSSI